MISQDFDLQLIYMIQITYHREKVFGQHPAFWRKIALPSVRAMNSADILSGVGIPFLGLKLNTNRVKFYYLFFQFLFVLVGSESKKRAK